MRLPAPQPAAAEAARPVHLARVPAGSFCIGLAGPAGIVLHLDVHRSRRQAVPRRNDRGDAAAVLLLPDAAVRLLRHPDGVLVSTLVTIGVMTKNSELLVMRACGISLYRAAAAAADLRRARERRAVSACRSACWCRRTARPTSSNGRSAHWPDVDDRAQPALDGGQRRRDLSLRFLRSASQPVLESPGLSTG